MKVTVEQEKKEAGFPLNLYGILGLAGCLGYPRLGIVSTELSRPKDTHDMSRPAHQRAV